MLICHLCISFDEMSVKVSGPLFNQVVCFFILKLSEFLVYFRQQSLIRCVFCKYFLPVCSLFSHSSDHNWIKIFILQWTFYKRRNSWHKIHKQVDVLQQTTQMNLILQFRKHFRTSTIASGSMLILGRNEKKKVNKTKNQDNTLCHNRSLYQTQHSMELGRRKH